LIQHITNLCSFRCLSGLPFYLPIANLDCLSLKKIKCLMGFVKNKT